MEKNFHLTELEKAALLKKAGIAKSLLEARTIHLQEMDGSYDPEISPEGDWDHTEWYGGPVSGGPEGYRGNNMVRHVVLSGRKFILLEKEVRYVNTSDFRTEEGNPDNPRVGIFDYVFQSEGEELDSIRVAATKLRKLLESAEKHLPEAIKMLREEYSSLNSK